MDAETREFLRLCDVTIAEVERALAAMQRGTADPAFTDEAELLLRNLMVLRRRTEEGRLVRPSRGAGFGMVRAVGEWAQDFTSLMRAAYALERFYQDHM
jgi:hypothetical protein